MSKTFIIRFHHLAYDDYKVTADSKEQAIEMIKSGEHGYYHHETDFLYNNESWFGGIYQVLDDGYWSDELTTPKEKKAIKKLYEGEIKLELLKKVVQQIKADEAMEDYTAIEELLSDVPKEKLLGFLKEDSNE